MPGKFEQPRGSRTPNSSSAPSPNPRRRKRRRRRRRLNPVFIAVCVLVLLLAFLCTRCGKADDDQASADPSFQETAAETTLQPLEVVSTATISAQGDLLMHRPVLLTCVQEDGSYDFSSLFQYLKPTLTDYDYNIANLETTLGGPDYPYQGNPSFNTPDTLADAAVDTGFHMLLTANNHCADTTTSGILRTLEQLRSKGLATLGTQLSNEEPKYEIVDVNGIQIGMLCYTYATSEENGLPTFNYRFPVTELGVVNYFTETNLDKLYSEVEAILSDMEAAGAEATVVFMHWGVEYEITESAVQRAIAQKLCDMGVDVIVGGHPHVVQPMDLLTSTTDSAHKTVCIYSMGNAISNQRIAEMNLKTGHTEDGMVFSVTFDKYSDGSVYVSGTDVLPTWVNYHANNGHNEYNILPLDNANRGEWQALFGLTNEQYANAQSSYDRTMAIVSAGLTECQAYLAQAKAEREAQ